MLRNTREGRQGGGPISHAGEAGARPTAATGAGCGGVDALSLRDFCEAVRFEGGGNPDQDVMIVDQQGHVERTGGANVEVGHC